MKKISKKILSLFLALFMLLTCSSCNNQSGTSTQKPKNPKVAKVTLSKFVKEYNENLLSYDVDADKLGEFKKSSYALAPSERFSAVMLNNENTADEYVFYEAKIKNQPVSIYLLRDKNDTETKYITLAFNSTKAGNPENENFQTDEFPYFKALLKTLDKDFPEDELEQKAKRYSYSSVEENSSGYAKNYEIYYQGNFMLEAGTSCDAEYLFDSYTGTVTGLFMFYD